MLCFPDRVSAPADASAGCGAALSRFGFSRTAQSRVIAQDSVLRVSVHASRAAYQVYEKRRGGWFSVAIVPSGAALLAWLERRGISDCRNCYEAVLDLPETVDRAFAVKVAGARWAEYSALTRSGRR